MREAFSAATAVGAAEVAEPLSAGAVVATAGAGTTAAGWEQAVNSAAPSKTTSMPANTIVFIYPSPYSRFLISPAGINSAVLHRYYMPPGRSQLRTMLKGGCEFCMKIGPTLGEARSIN
jgi:hypothetical protein